MTLRMMLLWRLQLGLYDEVVFVMAAAVARHLSSPISQQQQLYTNHSVNGLS